LVKLGGQQPGADLLEVLSDYEKMFECDLDGEGAASYFRSTRTRELDKTFGDIFHEILDLEDAILLDLRRRVCETSSTLRSAASCIAELDCLLSLSLVAFEQHLERPSLRNDGSLNISRGRHLLQEQAVESTFIPNNFRADSDGSERISIITGPNASGKSVFVSQVGLIIFLANAGCFVPADAADVPLTDRIFARFNTKETLSEALHMSSFLRDLTQVGNALRHATSSSVLLIDEFGKGTSSADGLALLASTLRYLDQSFSEKPPITLLATHFHELSDTTVLPRSPRIKFYSMAIVVQQNEEQEIGDDEKPISSNVTFLYTVKEAETVGVSYAVNCARLANMPDEVVKRMDEILRCAETQTEIQPIETERERERKRLHASLVSWLKSLPQNASEDAVNLLESVRDAHLQQLRKSPAKTSTTQHQERQRRERI
jgi:DNA mismatch repair protein MSH5